MDQGLQEKHRAAHLGNGSDCQHGPVAAFWPDINAAAGNGGDDCQHGHSKCAADQDGLKQRHVQRDRLHEAVVHSEGEHRDIHVKHAARVV